MRAKKFFDTALILRTSFVMLGNVPSIAGRMFLVGSVTSFP